MNFSIHVGILYTRRRMRGGKKLRRLRRHNAARGGLIPDVEVTAFLWVVPFVDIVFYIKARGSRSSHSTLFLSVTFDIVLTATPFASVFV